MSQRLAGLDVFGVVCKPQSPDAVIAKLKKACEEGYQCRIVITSHPIDPQDTPDHPGTVIFIQEEQ